MTYPNTLSFLTDAYHRHRCAKRLQRAAIAAIGTSQDKLIASSNDVSLDTVNHLLNCLGPHFNYATFNDKYPVENQLMNSDPQSKLLLGKLKSTGDVKLDLLASQEVFFFDEEDYNLPIETATSSSINKNLANSVHHIKYIKFKASQVYCKSDKYQSFELNSFLRNSLTLNFIHLFEINFSLNRYPFSELYFNRMRFLPYYDSNVEIDSNFHPIRAPKTESKVKFFSKTLVKSFNKFQPTILVSPRKKRIPQEFRPTPSPPSKSILKNTENENYLKEIQLASYCDLIDSNQFIILLDNQFKKRARKHRIQSKADKYKL